ncbi:NUDIX domain-containing protein [Tropicimonas sediminicola]|uniref:ADP-ribose pyrophosphatase YjhB, NUDIX family n=1 Tax=Tropicimonas sediminicola TaxID=1031541 RepID=A0A239LDJ6_9RHOB|nr:NUDIX domain-containing protein [Tropicimonas sediminicola]SNT27988.1 ADP-ribose pyrophosphatase YjhB, NUDIX family [Tropicimonas sediminicola]
MASFLAPIRPTVRAVIFREGKLLVQVKIKQGAPEYLTLPGGKQEPGETMQSSLARECLEEVGADVIVGRLLHVAEVFKPKDLGTRHQVEMLFACEVGPDYTPRVGHHPDPSQIDTIWASPLDHADRFRPAFALHLASGDAPVYLGAFDG